MSSFDSKQSPVSKLFQFSDKKIFVWVQDLVIREHVQAFVFVFQLRSGRLLSQCALVYFLGANANHKSSHLVVVCTLSCN